jgi:hypothetical protein
MSKIADLKNKKENNFNFIELVQRFSDHDETTYIAFIDRLLKEKIKMNVDNKTNPMFGDNQIENAFIAFLFSNIVLPDEMASINYFCQKHKDNVISGFDLQKTSMRQVVNKAKEIRKKEIENQKQNMVKKLYDQDEWLVVVPLSYEASLKYGATTKWCTAARENDEHYNNYTKKGQLIYCINKSNGVKYGFYNDLSKSSSAMNPYSTMSLWDVEDNYVEILYSDLPLKIIKVLMDYVKNSTLTNKELLKIEFNYLFGNQSNGLHFSGLNAEAIALAQEGKSLAAVKLLKEQNNISFNEAKNLFDSQYRDQYYVRKA